MTMSTSSAPPATASSHSRALTSGKDCEEGKQPATAVTWSSGEQRRAAISGAKFG